MSHVAILLFSSKKTSFISSTLHTLTGVVQCSYILPSLRKATADTLNAQITGASVSQDDVQVEIVSGCTGTARRRRQLTSQKQVFRISVALKDAAMKSKVDTTFKSTAYKQKFSEALKTEANTNDYLAGVNVQDIQAAKTAGATPIASKSSSSSEDHTGLTVGLIVAGVVVFCVCVGVFLMSGNSSSKVIKEGEQMEIEHNNDPESLAIQEDGLNVTPGMTVINEVIVDQEERTEGFNPNQTRN